MKYAEGNQTICYPTYTKPTDGPIYWASLEQTRQEARDHYRDIANGFGAIAFLMTIGFALVLWRVW